MKAPDIKLVGLGSEQDPDLGFRGASKNSTWSQLQPPAIKSTPFARELFSPLSPREFGSSCWEREARVWHRKSLTPGAEPFSIEKVFDLVFEISRDKARAKSVQLVNASKQLVSIERFARGSRKAIRQFYESGGSVVLRALNEVDPSCAGLANSFHETFGMRLSLNSYLTPPRSQTFKCHWDDHDVFVLQLEGEKNWRVYEPEFSLPLTSQVGLYEPSRSSPLALKATLRPGSVLYVPRGFPHVAPTAGKHSLHITIGLYPIRAYDVLEDRVQLALAEARRDLGFRCSLNREAQLNPEVVARIKAKFAQLLDRQDPEYSFDRLMASTALVSPEEREVADASLRHLRERSGEGVFRRTSKPFCLETRKHRGLVQLVFAPNRKLVFPRAHQQVLKRVLRSETFTWVELNFWSTRSTAAMAVVESLIKAGLYRVHY